MEIPEKVAASKAVGTKTLVGIGVFLIVLGISLSFYFSKTIENFFWEARTKSAINIVRDLSKHLSKTDIEKWNENSSATNLETFARESKRVLANVAALKIYTNEGVLAWTDLQSIKKGTKEDDEDKEFAEIRQAGYLINPASDETRNELGKQNLLEVWTEIKDVNGTTFGFAELYYNSSDIIAFTKKIQHSIWIITFIILSTILFLLRLILRKQNDLIVRQAKELINIVEKSPFGIYTINAKGVAITVNPKMLEFIGAKSAHDVIGHNILDMDYVIKTNSAEAIKGALAGTPFTKEINTTDTQGVEVHRLCTGTPLFKPDGKTLEQVLFTVEDITERKKLEKEIALHSKDLEVSIHERTKSLQEKIDELEQFQRLTVNREIRMTELKQEIEQMRIKLKELGVDFHPV